MLPTSMSETYGKMWEIDHKNVGKMCNQIFIFVTYGDMEINLGIMTKDQLKKIIVELDKENKKLKEYNGELIENHKKDIAILCEENKKLKEFKTKREEAVFYFKALAERVKPINSKEAEELQKYKKLFEKLYREELYHLEKENKQLKECNLNLQEWIDNKENVNKSLREENSNLKDELQEWLNAVGNM